MSSRHSRERVYRAGGRTGLVARRMTRRCAIGPISRRSHRGTRRSRSGLARRPDGGGRVSTGYGSRATAAAARDICRGILRSRRRPECLPAPNSPSRRSSPQQIVRCSLAVFIVLAATASRRSTFYKPVHISARRKSGNLRCNEVLGRGNGLRYERQCVESGRGVK